MNKTLTPWRRSWRSALLAGLPFLAASVALAQSAPAGDEEDDTVKLDKFVVTGSLIPIAADTPAVPVTIMTAADIAKTGITSDLTDVLKKSQPFFFGRANLGSDNANTRAASTGGASTVGLRNRSTLVLINGRRAAVNFTNAIGAGSFVDVSMIPVSAVERVEVLADGASATYGTDAVSGVVNIILKTNYNGAEVGGQFGWAPEASDWSSRSFYATVGAGNEKTQLTVSAEYRYADPLFQYERPWGRNIFLTSGFAGVVVAGGQFYYLNEALNAPPNLDLSPADLVAQGIYQGPLTQDQITRFLDLSERAHMLLESRRRSVALAAEHRWSDSLTVFTDVLVTHSFTDQWLNAQPVATTVTTANPNNPFNSSVQANNRFRPFPRIRSINNTGARGVFGVKGSLGGSWNYELAASLNRTVAHVQQKNLIDTATLLTALNAGTYNPFARNQAPGVIESFLGTGYQDFVSRLNSFDLRLNGELYNLPAGPLQVGLGAETRKEVVSMENDRNERTGAWLGATPTNPFRARQMVDAFFAEFRVPIFGGANARSWFNTLELGFAGRKEIYSGTTDPFVPKYTLRWLPFNDEFAIRGTYGESFTAPDLFSLFGPQNSGFTNSLNLQRYNTDGTPQGVSTGNRQYRSRGGSNPNLVPSESRNWTVGFVWSPRAIKGFSLTVDWFNIDERDIIGAIPQATLLQSVEQFGPASPYAHQVRIGTSVSGELRFDDGAPITTPGQVTLNPSNDVWMTNPRVNIAGIWQSGADMRLEYTHDTATMGRLTGSVTATYMHDYIQQILPSLAPAQIAGGFNGSTIPRVRTFTQLDWNYKNFGVGLNHTFIPGVTDLLAAVTVDSDSYHSFDLRFSYNFRGSNNRWLEGLRLGAGVNNVFSEDPPLMLGEQDQSRDINTYDPLGRFYYVRASYKF